MLFAIPPTSVNRNLLLVKLKSLFNLIASAVLSVNIPSSRLESTGSGVGVAQTYCRMDNAKILDQNMLNEYKKAILRCGSV